MHRAKRPSSAPPQLPDLQTLPTEEPPKKRKPVNKRAHQKQQTKLSVESDVEMSDGAEYGDDEGSTVSQPPVPPKDPALAMIEKITCILCANPLRTPVVSCAQNGNCIMCRSCAEKWLAETAAGIAEATILCPICKSKMFPLQEQTFLNNMLKGLPAQCSHDCGVNGLTRSTIIEHEATCLHRVIPCKYHIHGCDWKGTQLKLARHVNDCGYRIYSRCQKSLSQHDDIVRHKLKEMAHRTEVIMSRVSVLKNSTDKPKVCSCSSAFSVIDEFAVTSTEIPTPLGHLTVLLEKTVPVNSYRPMFACGITYPPMGPVECVLKMGTTEIAANAVLEVDARLCFVDKAGVFAYGKVHCVLTKTHPAVCVPHMGTLRLPESKEDLLSVMLFVDTLNRS